MLNVLQEMQGEFPINKDKVKNCAIYVFKVIGGTADRKVVIKSLVENDDSHLNLWAWD